MTPDPDNDTDGDQPKFEPIKSTVVVAPNATFDGATEPTLGAAATEKQPTHRATSPNADVTTTSRTPTTAPGATDSFNVNTADDDTTNDFTTTPSPKLTDVPGPNPEPHTCTQRHDASCPSTDGYVELANRPVGVTTPDDTDSTPSPPAFTADTVNVYPTPFTKPPTTTGDDNTPSTTTGTPAGSATSTATTRYD